MALVSRVLEFVMRHCHHDNRQVLRNNLEVLKTVVEVWRSSIQVPTMWVLTQMLRHILLSLRDPENVAPFANKDYRFLYFFLSRIA